MRIVFTEPEHLSPLVADLYRWWYRERRMPSSRLLVESFILMEPYWALRTGAVPFWMKFNMDPSLDCLERYLDAREPFDEIDLMLFSHGVENVGQPPIERWQAVLGRARRRGRFLGVDEDKYPRHFASLAKYYTELKKIPARYPLPGPLALDQFRAFLEREGGNYAVQWQGLD